MPLPSDGHWIQLLPPPRSQQGTMSGQQLVQSTTGFLLAITKLTFILIIVSAPCPAILFSALGTSHFGAQFFVVRPGSES